MVIYKHINKIKAHIKNLKNNNNNIGFVPTMGALHSGHLSLIEKAKNENDITVCSIFVNPTQFNEKNDFNKYPRTFEKDINKLIEINCDILFMPSEKEMYPNPDNRVFDFGYLDKIMEGKYRQGHFIGVAKIVSKLFHIVEPNNAYFGEKDFQQLVIMKNLAKKLKFPVKITGCPTIRENDGLAMSSRNALLSSEERKNAALINKTLISVKEKAGKLSIKKLKEWVEKQFAANSCLKLEYFEIADSKTLSIVEKWNEAKEFVACIAVFAGKVRLIDNIVFRT